jgi:hypothetical protein
MLSRFKVTVLPANLKAKVMGMKRKQNLVRGMETEHRKGVMGEGASGGAKEAGS